MGLRDIHFEYSIGSVITVLLPMVSLKKMATDPANLILYRPLPPNDQPVSPDVLLIVVIPAWEK